MPPCTAAALQSLIPNPQSQVSVPESVVPPPAGADDRLTSTNVTRVTIGALKFSPAVVDTVSLEGRHTAATPRGNGFPLPLSRE
jgi:hypothetical protein